MRYSRGVFAAAALACGFTYWWLADWWAYVELPQGRTRKFIMPWWWQLIESGLVGALGGGLIAGVWWVSGWIRSRRIHTCNQPTGAVDSGGVQDQ